jgi:sigma-B regulation protein RsbU (phosphoserine phosphatase)
MLGDDDYFQSHWYTGAKEGRPVWIDPYTDEDSGNVFISSCSVPIYRDTKDGRLFIGVVSADVALSWLQKTLSEGSARHGGYAFLISRQGSFISFPDETFVFKKTIQDLAREHQDQDLQRIAGEMTSGKKGVSFLHDFVTGEPSWIFYTALPLSDWSIGIVFQEKDLLADIFELEQNLILLGLTGLGFLFLIVFTISRRITMPLQQLSLAAEDISTGKLDATITCLARRDEVGDLARSFKSMQESLKKYIRELTTATALKERIANELKIAHDIQQSIVPKDFSHAAQGGRISVAGKLVPAREVGGDLYDCFAIDDHHTCFVIGDVSDKGVHAALLMAVAETLFRGLSKDLRHPDDILRIVNKEILERNKESMFITLFCGILNTDTGDFRYANAGHVPPILIRKDALPTLLSEEAGMPLGVNPDAAFTWQRITFARGDALFMYTDGVTESLNDKDEFFGEERLLAEIAGMKERSPEHMVASVLEHVQRHAGDRTPADDIAMLAFLFEAGPAQTQETSLNLTIMKDEQEVTDACARIGAWAEELEIDGDTVKEVTLAIEELVINALRFGFEGGKRRPIEVSLVLEKDRLVITIIDAGRPFNPLSAPAPDTALPFEQRLPGGLGIHFARGLLDQIDYERRDDQNHLTLIKMLHPKGTTS